MEEIGMRRGFGSFDNLYNETYNYDETNNSDETENDNSDDTENDDYFETENYSSNKGWDPDDCSDFISMLDGFEKTYDRDSSLEAYLVEKVKVKHAFDTICRQVSLSADLSRPYSGDDEFVSFTAHFIDSEWKLRKWVLCYQVIVGSGYKDVVIQALKDWAIEGKVYTFTWSHNDEGLIDMVKAQVETKKMLPLDGQFFHVECCALMFKSMVEDAFKEMYTISDKPSMLSRLELKRAWNLDTLALKFAVEDHSAGILKEEDELSEDEWRKVKSLIKFADMAVDAAKVLFLTIPNTANLYLHNLLELRMSLTKESSDPCAFTCKLAMIMLAILDEYLNKNFLVLSIATVMDPRFKMRNFENMSTNPETYDYSRVEELVGSLYKVYVEAEKLDCKEEEKSEEKWVKGVGKSDLELYLEEPVESFTKEFNVLAWWKIEEPKYPIMSKIAKDILGIPMSVAVYTDAFYTPRLAPVETFNSQYDIMDAVMCTRSWSKS